MATLTTKLTLTSTDVASDALSFSISDNLTVGAPSVGLSKIAIEVSGGSDTTLVASSANNKYVYVRHTGFQADGTTPTSNEVVIDFGTTDSIRLNSEEFAWFPAKASTAITAISNHTSTILVEYAYWTAG
jgi:hypothetical protein|tara:strand:- start:1120 stop:1509 length:390 start_codon:yes stop_codon:yes gene_type:complete